jgi:hypothetical protein
MYSKGHIFCCFKVRNKPNQFQKTVLITILNNSLDQFLFCMQFQKFENVVHHNFDFNFIDQL